MPGMNGTYDAHVVGKRGHGSKHSDVQQGSTGAQASPGLCNGRTTNHQHLPANSEGFEPTNHWALVWDVGARAGAAAAAAAAAAARGRLGQWTRLHREAHGGGVLPSGEMEELSKQYSCLELDFEGFKQLWPNLDAEGSNRRALRRVQSARPPSSLQAPHGSMGQRAGHQPRPCSMDSSNGPKGNQRPPTNLACITEAGTDVTRTVLASSVPQPSHQTVRTPSRPRAAPAPQQGTHTSVGARTRTPERVAQPASARVMSPARSIRSTARTPNRTHPPQNSGDSPHQHSSSAACTPELKPPSQHQQADLTSNLSPLANSATNTLVRQLLMQQNLSSKVGEDFGAATPTKLQQQQQQQQQQHSKLVLPQLETHELQERKTNKPLNLLTPLGMEHEGEGPARTHNQLNSKGSLSGVALNDKGGGTAGGNGSAAAAACVQHAHSSSCPPHTVFAMHPEGERASPFSQLPLDCQEDDDEDPFSTPYLLSPPPLSHTQDTSTPTTRTAFKGANSHHNEAAFSHVRHHSELLLPSLGSLNAMLAATSNPSTPNATSKGVSPQSESHRQSHISTSSTSQPQNQEQRQTEPLEQAQHAHTQHARLMQRRMVQEQRRQQLLQAKRGPHSPSQTSANAHRSDDMPASAASMTLQAQQQQHASSPPHPTSDHVGDGGGKLSGMFAHARERITQATTHFYRGGSTASQASRKPPTKSSSPSVQGAGRSRSGPHGGSIAQAEGATDTHTAHGHATTNAEGPGHSRRACHTPTGALPLQRGASGSSPSSSSKPSSSAASKPSKLPEGKGGPSRKNELALAGILAANGQLPLDSQECSSPVPKLAPSLGATAKRAPPSKDAAASSRQAAGGVPTRGGVGVDRERRRTASAATARLGGEAKVGVRGTRSVAQKPALGSTNSNSSSRNCRTGSGPAAQPHSSLPATAITHPSPPRKTSTTASAHDAASKPKPKPRAVAAHRTPTASPSTFSAAAGARNAGGRKAGPGPVHTRTSISPMLTANPTHSRPPAFARAPSSSDLSGATASFSTTRKSGLSSSRRGSIGGPGSSLSSANHSSRPSYTGHTGSPNQTPLPLRPHRGGVSLPDLSVATPSGSDTVALLSPFFTPASHLTCGPAWVSKDTPSGSSNARHSRRQSINSNGGCRSSSGCTPGGETYLQRLQREARACHAAAAAAATGMLPPSVATSGSVEAARAEPALIASSLSPSPTMRTARSSDTPDRDCSPSPISHLQQDNHVDFHIAHEQRLRTQQQLRQQRQRSLTSTPNTCPSPNSSNDRSSGYGHAGLDRQHQPSSRRATSNSLMRSVPSNIVDPRGSSKGLHSLCAPGGPEEEELLPLKQLSAMRSMCQSRMSIASSVSNTSTTGAAFYTAPANVRTSPQPHRTKASESSPQRQQPPSVTCLLPTDHSPSPGKTPPSTTQNQRQSRLPFNCLSIGNPLHHSAKYSRSPSLSPLRGTSQMGSGFWTGCGRLAGVKASLPPCTPLPFQALQSKSFTAGAAQNGALATARVAALKGADSVGLPSARSHSRNASQREFSHHSFIPSSRPSFDTSTRADLDADVDVELVSQSSSNSSSSSHHSSIPCNEGSSGPPLPAEKVTEGQAPTPVHHIHTTNFRLDPSQHAPAAATPQTLTTQPLQKQPYQQPQPSNRHTYCSPAKTASSYWCRLFHRPPTQTPAPAAPCL